MNGRDLLRTHLETTVFDDPSPLEECFTGLAEWETEGDEPESDGESPAKDESERTRGL